MAKLPALGFVGLGLMGAPMVRCLLARGYRVNVWNLEPERADLVTPHGAVWAPTPAAVRAASDLLLTCVLDGNAVEAVCFGPEGFVRANGGAPLLIDCSTVDPDRTKALAARLRAEAR